LEPILIDNAVPFKKFYEFLVIFREKSKSLFKRKENNMAKKLAILTVFAILLSLGFIFSGVALAQTTHYVSYKTIGTGESCAQPGFNDIQTAIEAAGPDDTVFVCPGNYEEDLVIKTIGLNLEGSGYKKTIIKGVAKLPSDSFPLADPNIDIQADGVSIHGFTIKSPLVTVEEYSSGIVLIGKNIKIYDNKFKVGAGDVSQGIQTWRATTGGLSDISGLNISHNKFTHLSPIPVDGLGYEGIYINHQPDPSDPQNPVIIQHNSFEGELIRAITTERSHTLILDNEITTKHRSVFDGAFPRGIQIQNLGPGGDDINNVTIVNNTITPDKRGYFGFGILISSGESGNTFLYGNEVENADIGISVQSPGNTLTKNEAEKSETWDCQDITADAGTAGTENTWLYNTGKLDSPDGICEAHSIKDKDDDYGHRKGKDRADDQHDWRKWWSWGKRGAGSWDDSDHHD
jgi:parallel beta-helix repeat protein